MRIRTSLLLLALLAGVSLSRAQTTYNAADCKESTFQGILNNGTIHDGDTITLPACSNTIVNVTGAGADNTWSSEVFIQTNAVPPVPLNINIIGAGAGSTVIIDNHDMSGCNGKPLIFFNGNIGDNTAERISGITIRGNTPDTGSCSAHLELNTGSHQLRIDHMVFGLDKSLIQSCTPTSVTPSGTTVTVVCNASLGSFYVPGQYVQLAAFKTLSYNGHFAIVTASGSTFTFSTAPNTFGDPGTPLGTINADVQMTTTAIQVDGDEWGVVDHSTFNGVFKRGVLIRHSRWQNIPPAIVGTTNNWGDNSWAQPDTMGTVQEMYVEDCDFEIVNSSGVGNVACEVGGRCVARYNSKVEYVGSHGVDTGQRERSNFSYEVYHNIGDDNGSLVGQWAQNRGGHGVVWNNILTKHQGSSYTALFVNQIYREADQWAPWGPNSVPHNQGPCDGSGNWDQVDGGVGTPTVYFSGTVGNGTSNTDLLTDTMQNFNSGGGLNTGFANYSIRNMRTGTPGPWGASIKSNTATSITSYASSQSTGTHTWNVGDPYVVYKTYPCLDQTGRGPGDLISGGGNQIVPVDNSCSVGTVCWPNEVLDPMYAWGNTLGGVPQGFLGSGIGSHVQKLRDIWPEAISPVFDGTNGTGVGTLLPTNSSAYSGAPNCSSTQYPGPGYFDTTNQTLYRCTALNTWTAFYTPLPYPHPFIAPIVVSPDLIFPTTAVGNTSAALITSLYNNSGSTISSTNTQSITGTNAADFAISATTCGATLVTGANCTISVTFTPSIGGAESAVLNVSDSGAGSPHTANLTGTGQTPSLPVATFSPTTFDFGQQELHIGTPTVITLTNTGSASMTISGSAFSGANSSDFSKTTTCGGTLAANASCSFTVTFTPGAVGARVGQLNVTDNAAGSPQSVPFTGSGFVWVVAGTGTISGEGTFQSLTIPPPCLQGTILVHASTSCLLNGNVVINYPTANSLYGGPSTSDCTITGSGPTCPTQSDLIINPDCSVGGPLPGCQPATHGLNATRLIIANGGEYVFSCPGACEMDITLHNTFSQSIQAGPRLNKVGGTGPFEIYSDQSIDSGAFVGSADCIKGGHCGSPTGGPPFVVDPPCETASPFCVVIGTTANYGTGSHTEDDHLKFICLGPGSCTFQLGSDGDHNR